MRHEPDQLDHALTPILPAVLGAAAIFGAAWAVVDVVTLTQSQRVAATAVSGGGALVFALLGVLAQRLRSRAVWARPFGFLAVLGLGLEGSAVLAITGQPENTVWVALALAGAGAVVLGRRWLIAALALVWAGWSAAAYLAVTSSTPSVDAQLLPQLALALAAATAIAVGVRSSRMSSLAELARALDRAREAEVRDPLTGVANVAGLTLLGSQVMEAARRHGDAVHCLVLDVDGLGAVNDQLGHLVGDEVLVGVADALVSAMRSGDVVARWGGDEFVVIGAGAGPSALEVERRVRAGLVEAPPASPAVWPGRVSAGRAVKEPWDDDSLESLLQKADREMLLRRALRREAGTSPYRPATVDKSELPPAQRHRPGAAPQSW